MIITKTERDTVRLGPLFIKVPAKISFSKTIVIILILILDAAVLVPLFEQKSYPLISVLATGIITVVIPKIQNYDDISIRIVNNRNIKEINKHVKEIKKLKKIKHPLQVMEYTYFNKFRATFLYFAKSEDELELERRIKKSYNIKSL